MLSDFLSNLQTRIEQNQKELTKIQRFFTSFENSNSFSSWAIVASYSVLESFIKKSISEYVTLVLKENDLKDVNVSILKLYLNSVYPNGIKLDDNGLDNLKQFLLGSKKIEEYKCIEDRFDFKRFNQLLERCNLESIPEKYKNLDQLFSLRNSVIHRDIDKSTQDIGYIRSLKALVEDIMNELYTCFNHAIDRKSYLTKS